MTDEELMKTSEIAALLQHRTAAVTRAWISGLPRDLKLKVAERDTETGEKLYYRSEVEKAIAATNRRGPYRRGDQPAAKEPRHEHGDRLPPD